MILRSLDSAYLVGANKPILCVDTCSVLDILRDPTRKNFGAHEAQAALELNEAFKSNMAFCLVAGQVHDEFVEHVAAIEEGTDKAIKQLCKTLDHVHQLAATLGGTGKLDVSSLDGHGRRSRAVAEQMLTYGMLLPTETNIVGMAFKRMSEPRTPARRGKDSMKDCVVIETYFAQIRELRNAGHSAPIVFVSSNVTDYMGEARRTLVTDIAIEFDALSLGFAPNLPAAKFSLGL